MGLSNFRRVNIFWYITVTINLRDLVQWIHFFILVTDLFHEIDVKTRRTDLQSSLCFTVDQYTVTSLLRAHSYLRFIRHKLLRELFSPGNHKKWAHYQLLNFSVHTKVDQIASVDVHAQYSTTHCLANSLSNSSLLINRK